MIGAKKFLAEVEAIAAEEPAYSKGHWGQDGMCDCIGLIIGAIRRAGGEWRRLHGSNYAARHEMDYLEPIASSSELKPGEVVYKSYEPGEGGYNLPERYAGRSDYYTGDMRDYYHVGVVISVYPLRIRHMTSPKPRMDTSIGKWKWHGKLKKVSLEEIREEANRVDVIIGGGDLGAPIHMRKAASTASAILADIPQGSTARLIEGGGVWNLIEWNRKTGYVMSRFVTEVGTEKQESTETVTVKRAELEKIYDQLGDWLGLRG